MFLQEAKDEGVKIGNYNMLSTFDVHRANREMYKFLHKRFTVKLKAGAVMTCAPGMGFEFDSTINKELGPNNVISKHIMLSDVQSDRHTRPSRAGDEWMRRLM